MQVENNTFFNLSHSRDEISRLFVYARGAGVCSSLSGSVHGLEGSQSLRRVSSIRRTFTAVKRKNVCLQVKFTVVSFLISTLYTYVLIKDFNLIHLFFI